MERFTIFLRDKLYVQQVFLEDETNLCRDAKVGRCDEHNFLKHRVLSELVSILKFCVELLLLHHIKVHHVAYIEVEDPVLAVLDAKRVAHIQFESLVFLYAYQLL